MKPTVPARTYPLFTAFLDIEDAQPLRKAP
jgi:hypothetical protein